MPSPSACFEYTQIFLSWLNFLSTLKKMRFYKVNWLIWRYSKKFEVWNPPRIFSKLLHCLSFRSMWGLIVHYFHNPFVSHMSPTRDCWHFFFENFWQRRFLFFSISVLLLMLQSKLYIPSITKAWWNLLSTAIWADK